ncbi:MAG: class I SAM-dependent methyltransferase, partial [Nitrospirota bacterium]
MGCLSEYPLCLEIGCGRGIGAEAIAKEFRAKKVVAIDIDPEQIERAQRNLKLALRNKIEFRVADAMALDEPDEKFDAVFSFGVLHHMEDWKKAVKEVSRVLKQGGEFFFEEPLMPFLRNFFVKTFTVHPEGGEIDLKEFKKVLKDRGIEIIRMISIGNLAIMGMGRKVRRRGS